MVAQPYALRLNEVSDTCARIKHKAILGANESLALEVHLVLTKVDDSERQVPLL